MPVVLSGSVYTVFHILLVSASLVLPYVLCLCAALAINRDLHSVLQESETRCHNLTLSLSFAFTFFFSSERTFC